MLLLRCMVFTSWYDVRLTTVYLKFLHTNILRFYMISMLNNNDKDGTRRQAFPLVVAMNRDALKRAYNTCVYSWALTTAGETTSWVCRDLTTRKASSHEWNMTNVGEGYIPDSSRTHRPGLIPWVNSPQIQFLWCLVQCVCLCEDFSIYQISCRCVESSIYQIVSTVAKRFNPQPIHSRPVVGDAEINIISVIGGVKWGLTIN